MNPAESRGCLNRLLNQIGLVFHSYFVKKKITPIKVSKLKEEKQKAKTVEVVKILRAVYQRWIAFFGEDFQATRCVS